MYIYSFGLGYLENERIAGDKLVTSVSNHCTFASLHLRCVVCTIYHHHQCSPLYAYIYALGLFYSNVKYSMMAACRFDGNRLNQPCVAKAQRVDMDALTVQPFLVPSFCCFYIC